MEVGVKWKFGNGNMYNGSVQWMTLPSHRTIVYAAKVYTAKVYANTYKLVMCMFLCSACHDF